PSPGLPSRCANSSSRRGGNFSPMAAISRPRPGTIGCRRGSSCFRVRLFSGWAPAESPPAVVPLAAPGRAPRAPAKRRRGGVSAGRGTPIPSWLTSILVRAAGLARDASKPNGQVVQWGDTDSGRLLKLQPAWTEASPAARQGAAWVDDLLDHRALVAAAARLA